MRLLLEGRFTLRKTELSCPRRQASSEPNDQPVLPGKDKSSTIKYYGWLRENIAGVLDAVDAINKELRIYTGFINDTGKELPTIIAFEDILEIGVNMT